MSSEYQMPPSAGPPTGPAAIPARSHPLEKRLIVKDPSVGRNTILHDQPLVVLGRIWSSPGMPKCGVQRWQATPSEQGVIDPGPT